MKSTNKSTATHHLAEQLLGAFGNQRPTAAQIHHVESLLIDTTIHHHLLFHPALNECEVSCLLLAAKGATMEEAAEILDMKFSSIDTLYRKIKRKLKSRSIAQAVFEGIKYGYLPLHNNKKPAASE